MEDKNPIKVPKYTPENSNQASPIILLYDVKYN